MWLCYIEVVKHNPHWPQILNVPFRISVIKSSGSKKTNALLNIIKQQDGNCGVINKIYLYLWIQVKQNINILLKNAKKWS